MNAVSSVANTSANTTTVTAAPSFNCTIARQNIVTGLKLTAQAVQTIDDGGQVVRSLFTGDG
jgi:hypothetical protein